MEIRHFARVSTAKQWYEREPGMANWQLDMDVVRQGLLLTKRQEGIAVDPLLVGCGLKTHDFDLPRP